MCPSVREAGTSRQTQGKTPCKSDTPSEQSDSIPAELVAQDLWKASPNAPQVSLLHMPAKQSHNPSLLGTVTSPCWSLPPLHCKVLHQAPPTTTGLRVPILAQPQLTQPQERYLTCVCETSKCINKQSVVGKSPQMEPLAQQIISYTCVGQKCLAAQRYRNEQKEMDTFYFLTAC